MGGEGGRWEEVEGGREGEREESWSGAREGRMAGRGRKGGGIVGGRDEWVGWKGREGKWERRGRGGK